LDEFTMPNVQEVVTEPVRGYRYEREPPIYQVATFLGSPVGSKGFFKKHMSIDRDDSTTLAQTDHRSTFEKLETAGGEHVRVEDNPESVLAHVELFWRHQ
jgi:hypothetical protein